MFQSHAGSIEASFLLLCRNAYIPFQSHAGSIEAVAQEVIRIAQSCFNPTLVRLRLQLPGSLKFTWTLFQSHAGSIEAILVRSRYPLSKKFQSHAGSIEAILVCCVTTP